MQLRILFSLSILASFVSCLDILGSIRWNDACPGANELGTAKAVLDDGIFSGGIKQDGNFVIYGATQGTYILSIISHDHIFDQLRIDIEESISKVTVHPYFSGTPLEPPSPVNLPYPIVISAKEKHVYFRPAESFNLISMFSNPMMLLMVGGAAMVLAMPYLLKNLDPEALEELKEQQNRVAGIQNTVTNGDLRLSTLLGGADDSSATTSAGKPPPPNAKNRKKR